MTSWPYASLADKGWLLPAAATDRYLAAARDAVRGLLAPRPTSSPATQEQLLAAMAAAQEVRERLDWVLLSLVGEGRAAGLSWAQVAQALGVRKQAAHQRFGPYVAAAMAQALVPDGDPA